MYFKTLKLTSSNLNFSRCCSTDGSSSITIDSTPGTASYVIVYGGIATVISCIFGEVTLAFSYSNFVDWFQAYDTSMFWANVGLTTFEYCSIYPSKFYRIGTIKFLRGCYGNVGNGISSAPTTLFPQILVRADDYCYNLNGRLEFSVNNSHITSLVCLFILIQILES